MYNVRFSMMIKNLFGRLLRIWLVLILFLAGCAPTDSTSTSTPETTATKNPSPAPTSESDTIGKGTAVPVPISVEKIIIAHLGNATGKASEFVQPKIRGVVDMVAAINDQGGINDVPIELLFADTLGQSAGDHYTQLLEIEKPLLLILYDWRDALAVQPLAQADGIPLLLIDSPAEQADNLFAMLPSLPDQFVFFMNYAIDHWDEIKPAGAQDQIKLAYVSWPDEAAPPALTDATRRALQQLGIELVVEAQINPTYAEDTQDIVNRLQREEVNLLYTNTWAYGPAILVNDLTWLKMDTVITAAGPNQALDVYTYGYLINRPDLDGFYAPTVSLWWSDNGQRAIETALVNFTQNDRTAGDQTLGRLLAQAAVDLARQAILLNSQNGEELTTENLLLTLNTMPETRLLDGLMSVDFSSGAHSPTSLQVRRVDGMLNFVVISDYLPSPK